MSASFELPDDPTALALLVQDSTQPQERRDAALVKLDRLVIQRIANDLAPACEEFHTEALSFVWEQLEINKKFEPHRGRFKSWCDTVLYHLHIEFLRKRSRWPACKLVGDLREKVADPSGASSEFGDELRSRMHRLRETLDRISLHFNSTLGGVDYFAVLLLQLRLAISRCLIPQQDELELLPEKPAVLIAWVLPWRPVEQSRSFRAGWPMLQKVWEAIGEVLNRPPYRIDAPELCGMLTRLNGGSCEITAEVWNQWVRRAKKQTRACVDACTWEDEFSGFLPDYRPRQSPADEGENP